MHTHLSRQNRKELVFQRPCWVKKIAKMNLTAFLTLTSVNLLAFMKTLAGINS